MELKKTIIKIRMKKIFCLIIFIITISGYSQCVKVGTLPMSETNSSQVVSMNFYDTNIGYAILHGNYNGSPYTLVKTIDGGTNWTILSLPLDYRPGRIVYKSDADHFFLEADDKTFGNVNLYRTIDGGQNFTKVNITPHFRPGKFYFRDSLNGFYYINEYLTQNIHYTNDGGNTWKALFTTPGIGYIYFSDINSSNGIAFAGTTGIMYSNDDGKTWSAHALFNRPNDDEYKSPQFVDSMIGFMTGNNKIIKTTDGGLNWYSVGNLGGHKMIFKNENIGYLIKKSTFNYPSNDYPSSSASFFKTTNGGESWTPFSGIEPFKLNEEISDISIPTQDVGYVITTSGILYKFENVLNTKEHQLKISKIYPNPVSEFLYIEGFVLIKMYSS